MLPRGIRRVGWRCKGIHMNIRINRLELDLGPTSGFFHVPGLFDAYWDFRGRMPSSFDLMTPKAIARRNVGGQGPATA